MEWDERLFAFLDDLEGRAEALYDAERETDLADRSRAEYAAVTLAGRLMASSGTRRRPRRARGGPVAGVLQRVGPDWCLARGAGPGLGGPAGCRRAACEGASDAGACPRSPGHRSTRLGLGSALRRLADAGEPCVVHGVDGTAHDGAC